jgi:hypothetical protein
MQLSQRIRALERTARARFDGWLKHATDAELRAFGAHFRLDPELQAELATWTDEQVEAALRGVPLAKVRALQHPVK